MAGDDDTAIESLQALRAARSGCRQYAGVDGPEVVAGAEIAAGFKEVPGLLITPRATDASKAFAEMRTIPPRNDTRKYKDLMFKCLMIMLVRLNIIEI